VPRWTISRRDSKGERVTGREGKKALTSSLAMMATVEFQLHAGGGGDKSEAGEGRRWEFEQQSEEGERDVDGQHERDGPWWRNCWE